VADYGSVRVKPLQRESENMPGAMGKDRVCLNADMTKIVDCDSDEAAHVYSRDDADKILGEKKATARSANKAREAAENK
jgi:hypothetical protein